MPFLSDLPLRRTLIRCAFWLPPILVTINNHGFEFISIYGQSMSPTLSPHYHETGARDHVLLQKWLPTLHMRRGDIVSFWAPYNSERLVVKRVVALEGDVVYLDRRRFAGGDRAGIAPLEERSKAGTEGVEGVKKMGEDLRRMVVYGQREEGDELGVDTQEGAVRVPPGHVWIEGDNWRETLDSNDYGPISRGLIMGRALCVVYPWAKFGEKPWEKPVKGLATRVKEGTFKPLPR